MFPEQLPLLFHERVGCAYTLEWFTIAVNSDTQEVIRHSADFIYGIIGDTTGVAFDISGVDIDIDDDGVLMDAGIWIGSLCFHIPRVTGANTRLLLACKLHKKLDEVAYAAEVARIVAIGARPALESIFLQEARGKLTTSEDVFNNVFVPQERGDHQLRYVNNMFALLPAKTPGVGDGASYRARVAGADHTKLPCRGNVDRKASVNGIPVECVIQ